MFSRSQSGSQGRVFSQKSVPSSHGQVVGVRGTVDSQAAEVQEAPQVKRWKQGMQWRGLDELRQGEVGVRVPVSLPSWKELRDSQDNRRNREPRAVSHPIPLPSALQGPPTLLSPCQGTQQPHHYSAGPLTPTHSQAWACSVPPFKLGGYQGGLWSCFLA